MSIHSSAFSTLFSMASAGFPNTAFQICVLMIDVKAVMNRISRLGAFEEDSVRQIMSSSTRVPIRYPSVFSLFIIRSMDWIKSTVHVPTFQIIDTTHSLLSILHYL